MRKPEVIKMHLDILFKSITFLNKHKIEVMLQDYKQQKIQRQKEEEERLQMQNHLRKIRGRSLTKKDRKEADLSLDAVVEESGAAAEKSIFAEANPQIHNNVSSSKRVTRKACQQSQEKKTLDKDAGSNESSTITENSHESGSQKSKLSLSKKLLKSSAWRKIYKKLRKQKKLSRRIEKIFYSEKQNRNESSEAIDPLMTCENPAQEEADFGCTEPDYWGQFPEAQMTPAFNQNIADSPEQQHEGVEVSAFSLEEPKDTKQSKVTTRLQEKREQLKKPSKKLIHKKPLLKKEFRKVNKSMDNQENDSILGNSGLPHTPSFSVFPETGPTTNNFYNNNYTINHNNFQENVTNIFIQGGSPNTWQQQS